MSPPLVLLYDGDCRFCVAGSRRLLRLARPGSIEALSFRTPGAIGPGGRFPGVSPEAAERALQLVDASGRVSTGAEAVARALRTRPVVGAVAALYWLPGLRWLADRVYAWVARNRFRIAGRVAECDGGACRIAGH